MEVLPLYLYLVFQLLPPSASPAHTSRAEFDRVNLPLVTRTDELPNTAPLVELVMATTAKVNTNEASLNMILKQIEAQGEQLRVLQQTA